jgi:glycosyltransferase involved in cell wall biosynthesis
VTVTEQQPGGTVLWLLPEFPPNPGGIGTHAGLVAPALVDRGYDTHLLIGWGGPSRERLGAVDVIREPLRAAFEKASPAAVMQARRRVEEIKSEVHADCYHVHLSDPTPILHLATVDTSPAPTVLTLHNEMAVLFSADDPDSLLFRLMEHATITTGVSSTVIRQVAAVAPQLARRLVTVPNGVPVVDDIAPMPHDPAVLAIGRLLPQKGFDRLVAAWPAVVESQPSAHLHILGEGPERSHLESAIDQAGVTASVTLHGLVPREVVPSFIDACTLLAAPSRHEGMPYAVLEAAARARPVVASRTGGIDEVVVDRTTGVLLGDEALEADAAGLAAAIAELLDDRDLAARLGRQGRARVADLFSLDACADAYDLIYRAASAPPCDVAVIIPAFNAERHLRDAIDSALAEAESVPKSVHVLVVDDGSSDGTADVARDYAGCGVALFRQPNLGTVMARNAGIALTNSRYIANLDADDVWPAGRLAALLAPLEADPELQAVFGRAVEFADADAPTWARWNPDPALVRAPTVGLVRRSAFDTFGAFPIDDRNNDQIRWASLALAGGLRYETVDDVVLRRRIHATNKSHDRPFTNDRSRVGLIKQALDRRREGRE